MGAPPINPAEFVTWLLVFVRMSMLAIMAPVFASPLIVTPAKVLLALGLTVLVALQLSFSAEALPMTWPDLTILVAGEVLAGLLLAFLVRVVLEAANIAGEYVGFQMGLSIVNVVDPQTGTQVSVISQFIYLTATLLFLQANGHLLILKALIQSYQIAPPGFLNLWNPQPFTEILRAMARMYVLAIKIGAPIIAVLFCLKAAFGIVAKAVPQMNILFVGMPLYIVVGLIFIFIALPFWPAVLGRALLETEQALEAVLRILGGP